MARCNGDVTKLPKWAQEYVKDLVQEREVAVNELNDYLKDQVSGPFEFTDLICTGENPKNSGPVITKRYVHAHRCTVRHAGVQLDVLLRHDGEIALGYSTGDTLGTVLLQPTSYQQFRLKAHSDECIRLEKEVAGLKKEIEGLHQDAAGASL